MGGDGVSGIGDSIVEVGNGGMLEAMNRVGNVVGDGGSGDIMETLRVGVDVRRLGAILGDGVVGAVNSVVGADDGGSVGIMNSVGSVVGAGISGDFVGAL